MKRSLVVTGRKGKEELKKISAGMKGGVEVHVCNVDVAAFLSTDIIMRELADKDLSTISEVIIPGTVPGDLKELSERLGVAVARGPNNLQELETFLLGEKKQIDWKDFFEPQSFLLKIGREEPIFLSERIAQVMAEIIDGPLLGHEELGKRARYYVDSGARIIDIGMIAGQDNSDKIPGMVKAIRKQVAVPLSIDSLNQQEILTAVENGIDLVVSLDFSNYQVARKIDVPAVIIPRRGGKVPGSAGERIKLIEKLMKKVRQENFEKMIVDLILSPLNFGFSESLAAYGGFRKRYPRIPLMMGAGNITELMDVDSVGVNGLLAGMAAELGINLLLTTEASVKTRGSVGELVQGARMMALAKSRHGNPKNLGKGVNLLRLKEKRAGNQKTYQSAAIAARERSSSLEKGIHFQIYLTVEGIRVVYYQNGKPLLHFKGQSATSLYQEIVSRKLIKDLEHAAYLGRELGKAEMALKLERTYQQDEELFDFL